MKKIILVLFVFVTSIAQAQVTKATLQASGLTCSMCSNAINKALKTLDFVASIEPNIKTSTFEITFNENAVVDFDKIKSKVEGAGFSVAKLSAFVNFNNVAIAADSHVLVGNNTYHFLNVKEQTLNGQKEIRILDKGYLTAKEYKKNNAFTKMDCYKTGVAAACCAKDGLKVGQRIYHVTI
jgi:copper chaperone CopZ